MVESGDLSENMKVRARDGEELGTIIRLDAGGFLVEKGISSLTDYRIPIALVTAVRDGVAYLSVTRAEMAATHEMGRRTLREETSEFVHARDDVGGSRSTDDMREGTSAPEGTER